MNIMLVERIVERCNTPSSPNYLKVEKMTAKLIVAYTSNIVPRQGEIIFLDDDKIYDVVQVIYQAHGHATTPDFTVHVEVKPHNPVHDYCTSGFSFKENWPTVISLPTDLSYYKNYEQNGDDGYEDDDPYYV